jgi:hypothetical protein
MLALLVAGCSLDATTSDEYQQLEQELAATNRQLAAVSAELATVTAERDALAARESPPPRSMGDEPIDYDAFAAARGSGDADQIRAFSTDDAVMMPFGHILATLSDHPMPEYWDVAGPGMDREAAEHDGAILQVLETRQMGDMIVSTSQWTFPEELFPDLADTVILAADIQHVRDSKIWRHFTDFEVYANGRLIEL